MKCAIGFLRTGLLLLAALVPAAARADTYDTATLVNVTTAGKEDVQFLYDRHIDIVGVRGDVVKALVTAEQLEVLSESGLKVEILYAEMQEDRQRWTEASASYTSATSYYTPSRFDTVNPPAGSLMEHLLEQHDAHPDITRLHNLGASQDGAYDIIAMEVSKNPDVVEAEPKIRIYANIHGDEKGGVMVACDVLDTILAGYTAVPQDTTAERLVDGTEMWFIPIGNPHGNANNTRYNSRNVDCNRNFWGPEGSDAPPAWSEAETAAIRDLTEAATADHAKKRFALSISFHEGETVFNSVWNYTAAAPTDEPIFWSSRTGGTGCGSQTVPNCPTLAPHGLAQAYKDGCTMPGFWYTEGYDWFGTRGDTNDWAYGAWTDLDATVELNSTKTPPAAEIPTYCAEHRQAVLNYMLKAFQGIHGVMTDQSTGAPLDGTVTVTATASAEIPVPHDYQAVFTDPLAGDFHRVLEPGTYTVVCDAPGYRTTILTGVTVTADTRTIADCPMTVMGLVYYSSTVTDACSGGGAYSGDGILDAGEDATLPLTVGNLGSISATSVQGTLSTNAPGITITRGTASFADVPVNETVESSPPHFRFSVGTGVPCGTVIPFSLHLTAAQGAWDDSFSVAVGQTSAGPSETLLIRRFGGTQGGAGLAHVDSNDEPQGTCTMHACDAIPPTIVCPTPETVECQADGRSEVDLPHATATDVCQPGGLVISNTFTPNGADASGSYPLGTTVVTFTASDASGNRASCRTTVTVRDTIAPILTAVASPSVLWPPSHDMVAVHATVVATDACDPSPSFVLASVTSSEPDEAPGDGDGHTTGDIQDATIGTADLDVLLRAERDGNGPGRTYTIEYRARDASGNVGAGRATVEVPHDLGAARPVATEMAKKASAHGR